VTTVRRLHPSDREQWDRLWAGYLEFYGHALPPGVSATTFARLTAGSGPLVGLVAENGDGQLVGFAHLVFHPSTWAETEYCYLEDLFVEPTGRRGGVGQALVAETYAEADRRDAEKVYWQTESGNREARALYDRVARDTGFLVYARPERS
jgi:GNAT superfamily N-acetyltransferase